MIGLTGTINRSEGGESCKYGITRVYREYLDVDTWNKPADLVYLEVYCVGAGGGGASGAKRPSGTVSRGGGGGGTGPVIYRTFVHDQLPSSVAISTGSGGPGGIGVTTNNSTGNEGSAGGNSSFGSLVIATGGRGAPNTGNGADAWAVGNSTYGPILRHIFPGIGGGTSNASGNAGFGGTTVAANGIGFYNYYGNGGSGGGVNTSNAQSNGGAGSRDLNEDNELSSVVSGGTAGGGHGNAGHNDWTQRHIQPFIPFSTNENTLTRTAFLGTGGSGGGSHATPGSNGGNGGGGGQCCGAGGGGGAIRDDLGEVSISGSGGTGGRGLVIVIEHIMTCTETTE